MPIPEEVVQYIVQVVLATITVLAPAPRIGQATYYAPNLMARVYEYRLQVGDVEPCDNCVGYVALLSPEDIGKIVWLQHPDGGVIGPVLSIDCAQAAHKEMLENRGWVVDVGWPIAQQWNMRGPIEGVAVMFAEPERGDSGESPSSDPRP